MTVRKLIVLKKVTKDYHYYPLIENIEKLVILVLDVKLRTI